MEFFGGMIHPWINLESALILFALSLWVAQWLEQGDLLPLGILAGGVSVGAGLGICLQLPPLPWVAFLLAMTCGLSVAANLSFHRTLAVAALMVVTLYAGYVAGVDAAPDVNKPLLFLGGVLVGGFVIPLFVVGGLANRKEKWIQIGIRIVGSWIAAVGLMLLALSMKK